MSERSRLPGSGDSVEILLVEDNPGDVRLVEEAFEATDRQTEVHTVTNGYDALHFLKRRRGNESLALPDLALVDLNVPGKDGCEVLEAIRAEPRLRRLPVLMLTSSEAEEDVARCYDANANAYLTKPTDPDEFVSLVEAIEQFWFETAHLPPVSQ